jgi:hypothetical protein
VRQINTDISDNTITETELGRPYIDVVIKHTFIPLMWLLVPGIPYNVSIAALNMAGEGDFSVLIIFTRELSE